ncbi:preprotein translocase subunit SecY, partial [Patescibacteria group bacterium]
ILAGIVAHVPLSVKEIVVTYDPSKIPSYIAFLILAIVITASVVIINEGRRNIPVSYAKQVRGNKMYGGVSTYLPLNVNPAGVIPIIFALSIMLFPGMAASFLGTSSIGWVAAIANWVGSLFQNQWFYGISYFALVVLFTYFYTAVTFDPKNVAENLQKMGGFIPGIRPGKSTVEFLYYILNRVLLFGAVFLGTIAVLPSVVQGITGVQAFGFVIGGTALLIIVAVILDTLRQVESQLTMRDYEGF